MCSWYWLFPANFIEIRSVFLRSESNIFIWHGTDRRRDRGRDISHDGYGKNRMPLVQHRLRRQIRTFSVKLLINTHEWPAASASEAKALGLLLFILFLLLFTSDKGGGICDCPRCLSVCLSVSKITQKRMHGFGWNFACRQVSGHGRTDQFLSPIRIIVRMPEPENLKVEDLSSVEVGQTSTSLRSLRSTGHGMHCREILFTPRCSPRAREFPGSGQLFCTTYGCGATGRQTCAIFGVWPLSEVHALHRVLLYNKPTSTIISPVQSYYPRRRSSGCQESIMAEGFVEKLYFLSLEWKSEAVMDAESGDDVKDDMTKTGDDRPNVTKMCLCSV